MGFATIAEAREHTANLRRKALVELKAKEEAKKDATSSAVDRLEEKLLSVTLPKS